MSCLTTPTPAASEYLSTTATTASTPTTPSTATLNENSNEPNDTNNYSEQPNDTTRLVKSIDFNNNNNSISSKIKTEMSPIKPPTDLNLIKTITTTAEDTEAADFNRPTTPPASTPSPVQVKNVNKRKLKNQFLAGRLLSLLFLFSLARYPK
jgi:hypothetical protein